MTDLATLAQLKAALSIPSGDTSRDAELTGLLGAANRSVLKLTRLSPDAGDITGELHSGVRDGTFIYTNVRPIDTAKALTVEGRASGSTTWTTLAGDVEDAFDGRIRILPSGDTGAMFPSLFSRPRYTGWRRTRWDVVRLSYSYLAATGIEDVIGASISIASWWAGGAGQGAVGRSETVGQVSQQASGAADTGVPQPFRAMLAAYTQRIRVAR